jgi:hypothetical protein
MGQLGRRRKISTHAPLYPGQDRRGGPQAYFAHDTDDGKARVKDDDLPSYECGEYGSRPNRQGRRVYPRHVSRMREETRSGLSGEGRATSGNEKTAHT